MFGGISPWQLLIVLLIVLLIFGTKKLRNVGGDLGSAIRDFRKGMNDSEDGGDGGKETEESTGSGESTEAKDADSPDTKS